jgi:hypothetical protein
MNKRKTKKGKIEKKRERIIKRTTHKKQKRKKKAPGPTRPRSRPLRPSATEGDFVAEAIHSIGAFIGSCHLEEYFGPLSGFW